MRSFGQLEGEIMRVVWQRDEPITIREIADALNESRHLAHTTIITVAERLREKGWLTRQRASPLTSTPRNYCLRSSTQPTTGPAPSFGSPENLTPSRRLRSATP